MSVQLISSLGVLLALLGAGPAGAGDGDVAMFGGGPARNMVSDEKGLPTQWDVKSGLNVLWSAELGSQSYAGPIIIGGKVFVGTNNERQYNEKLKGDRGNVMAFRVADGKLLWQSAHPKLGAGRVNDWPLQGVCSTPAVDGDRVYYVSNRAEVVCADDALDVHEAELLRAVADTLGCPMPPVLPGSSRPSSGAA